jgi:hypothetical protein
MKKILFAAIALALFVPAAADAQQRGPKNAPYDLWCREQPLDRSTVQICSAYTYEQCMASRVRYESCYLNPRYDPRFRR